MKDRVEIRRLLLACLGSLYLLLWLGGLWAGAFVLGVSNEHLSAWAFGGGVVALVALPCVAFLLGRPGQ